MLEEIYQQFAQCKMWEEKYRLLVKLGKMLPLLSNEARAQLPEISGCESRLWFDFSLEPRQVQCASEARLMQGILFVIKTALEEKSEQALRAWTLEEMFDELGIAKHLTATRQNGLMQIQAKITQQLQAK